MRVFLYEFVTGGGCLAQQSLMQSSLLREGHAMWSALATDLSELATLSELRVCTLRDKRLPPIEIPRVEITYVDTPQACDSAYDQGCHGADFTLLVAPETNGTLLSHALRCEASGGRLASSTVEFIRLTADKSRLAAHLKNHEVPTPIGTDIEFNQSLPSNFPYPAVWKPRDGAGSEHIYLLANSRSTDRIPKDHGMDARLEQYVPGISCSVSFLCAGFNTIACPPMRQCLSEDGRFRYLGGRRLMEPPLAARAISIGERAMRSLPPNFGYVGIDIVLGESEDGTQDYIIEVNPRLTTSYIALRKLTDRNLAEAMLQFATNYPIISIEFGRDDVHFLSDGTVTLNEIEDYGSNAGKGQ